MSIVCYFGVTSQEQKFGIEWKRHRMEAAANEQIESELKCGVGPAVVEDHKPGLI